MISGRVMAEQPISRVPPHLWLPLTAVWTMDASLTGQLGPSCCVCVSEIESKEGNKYPSRVCFSLSTAWSLFLALSFFLSRSSFAAVPMLQAGRKQAPAAPLSRPSTRSPVEGQEPHKFTTPFSSRSLFSSSQTGQREQISLQLHTQTFYFEAQMRASGKRMLTSTLCVIERMCRLVPSVDLLGSCERFQFPFFDSRKKIHWKTKTKAKAKDQSRGRELTGS